jgi:hypothetical protein
VEASNLINSPNAMQYVLFFVSNTPLHLHLWDILFDVRRNFDWSTGITCLA